MSPKTAFCFTISCGELLYSSLCRSVGSSVGFVKDEAGWDQTASDCIRFCYYCILLTTFLYFFHFLFAFMVFILWFMKNRCGGNVQFFALAVWHTGLCKHFSLSCHCQEQMWRFESSSQASYWKLSYPSVGKVVDHATHASLLFLQISCICQNQNINLYIISSANRHVCAISKNSTLTKTDILGKQNM